MCSLQTKRQYCTDAITIRRDEAHVCGCGLRRGLLRGASGRSGQGKVLRRYRSVARCSWATRASQIPFSVG
eukprot:6867371-Prymnesium_polylepis.1